MLDINSHVLLIIIQLILSLCTTYSWYEFSIWKVH